MDRIKGLHEKQAGGQYGALVPFGTDGQLVDMFSGLNLEYEVKLGTPHYVTIGEIPPSVGVEGTRVVEHYVDPTELPNDYAAPTKPYYRVTTDITESGTTTSISVTLDYISSGSSATLKTKTTTIDQSTGIVIKEVIS